MVTPEHQRGKQTRPCVTLRRFVYPKGVTLMKVIFIASVSVISADPAESRKLYIDTLGLPLQRLDGDYFASEQIGGSKHFGVWPLTEAAQACFGAQTWPADLPVPQVSIEFELADPEAVARGAEELTAAGFRLLHPTRTEPWGQTVARILSREGIIVGLSYAPWLHEPIDKAGDV
jgi:catechol 2,3-dioxygenase-like lactoylglutathione lyase family enzyme